MFKDAINYNIMKSDQLEKRPLPLVTSKPHSMLSIFQIIRLKKAELSKQLDLLEVDEISLPIIQTQKQQIGNTHQTDQRQDQNQAQNKLHTPRASNQNTPANKYKTILDQLYSGQKSKINNVGQNILLRSKVINKHKKQDLTAFQINHKNIRTRTQTKPREQRKHTQTSNAVSIQKSKLGEDNTYQYEQFIKKFCQYVQTVPKNMKMRNQENLSDTITQLEHFNPFFNRNQRIVNICLLKMGKIHAKIPPFQLYKAGEQLDHFFIILHGKVKVVEGSFRRICQTGETVLQQILFSERTKKVSLERAKVVNPTYLLQLKIDQYKKLKEQLIRHGLKLGFQQMQSIIKRNYIIKNWMRNKRQVETNK